MDIFSREKLVRNWRASVRHRLSRDEPIVPYRADGKSVLMARAPAHDGGQDTISSKSGRDADMQTCTSERKLSRL
ncbi:hypothetical protein IVB22_25105 [Bradyrhizobium sp. 190]|nr:hypothetical protein [Bradyrhizobium sp. 190]